MASQLPEPTWGTVRAAARRFGISRETLGRAIRRGEIPAYVLPGHGRWRRVCFADVEAWLRSQRVAPSANAVDFARELLTNQEQRVAFSSTRTRHLP